MGLIDKTRQTQQQTMPQSQLPVSIQFTKEECEFLLQLIAQSTFEGKDVAVVYETVAKIENQYVSLSESK